MDRSKAQLPNPGMKRLMFLTILACCTLSNVHASVESSRQSFWSLVRGDNLLDSAHLAVPELGTMDELNSFLQQNGRRAVVLFGANWCGSCKKLKPGFENLTGSAKVPAAYIDVDRNPAAAEKYNIIGIPALRVIDTSGTATWSNPSPTATPQEINDAIGFAQ